MMSDMPVATPNQFYIIQKFLLINLSSRSVSRSNQLLKCMCRFHTCSLSMELNFRILIQ